MIHIFLNMHINQIQEYNIHILEELPKYIYKLYLISLFIHF